MHFVKVKKRQQLPTIQSAKNKKAIILKLKTCATKNATDLLQVVNFIDLRTGCNKLVTKLQQAVTGAFVDLLKQPVEATCSKSVRLKQSERARASEHSF